MSKLGLKLDRQAVRDQILKGSETKSLIKQYGEEAYSKLSVDGYVLEERTYPERVGVAIYAEGHSAKRDNLDNNSLLKAVSG